MQYDSEKGWSTWRDFFRVKVPEITNELKSCLADIDSAISDGEIWNSKDMIKWSEDCGVCTDELTKFFNSVDASGDIMGQYKAHLVKLQKEQSTFTTFTQKAGTALKSLGAALGSMAVNWAIGKARNKNNLYIEKEQSVYLITLFVCTKYYEQIIKSLKGVDTL